MMETSSLGGFGRKVVRASALLVALLLGSMALARLTLDVVHAQDDVIVVISLVEEAKVESGVVCVSDLAQIQGESKLAVKIGNAIVCRAPSDGAGEEVAAGRVKRALMRAGVDADSFIIEGERVQVYLRSLTVEAKADEAEVAGEVSAEDSDAEAYPAPSMEVGGAYDHKAEAEAKAEREANKRRIDDVNTTPRDQGEKESVEAESSAAGYRPGQYFRKRLEDKQASNANKPKPQAATDVVELVINQIGASTSKALGIDEQDVSVREVRRNMQLSRLPKGAQRLASKVECLNLGCDLGELRYRFSVVVNDETFEDLVLTVNVQRFANVVVYARDVRNKQAILASDLMLQRLSFDTKAENYFTDIDDVIGMAPRVAGRAGSTVAPSDLERAILVQKGDLVVVYRQFGGSSIELQGIALESGARGDTIKLERVNPSQSKNRSSHEKPATFHGVVESSGRARIATAGTNN